MERPTFGPQVAKAARMLGRPLMPWQSEFADVLGEYDQATGVPYYSTAFFTVPRRSGKTLLLFSWSLRRMARTSQQRLTWSAQSRSDAREIWIDELYPMLERSKFAPVIKTLGRGNGTENIRFKNGSVMRLVAPGDNTGHGKGLHGSAEDELMADTTAWRQQVFGPAMLTVPDSQSLKTSAAGTAKSVVFNALQRAGREAVLEGRSDRICYLEYSADDDWDHLDESTYWRHMPALGHTITPNKIRSAIEEMLLDPAEGVEGVRRAYGNIKAGAGEGTIPQPVWERVCSRTAEPSGRLTFAVAVAQDRSSAAIAVADAAGRVELIDHRGGTGWVIDKANHLTESNPGSVVVLDQGGPAGALADSITECDPLAGSKVIDAHGAFFDAVVECTGIEVRQDTALDKAVDGAVKKTIGDRFVWSRKASTEDVAPLEAATLAWWAARRHETDDKPSGFAFVMGD